ncbi:zf-TFIIB domain-containing protein [Psychromonas sp. KJ10-2]|uniref:TFIIB-type zinc ribbon-containing protein n=1 Tax=Psychromonas sp. KJ10-2 TaxID=3391822 RepID=UPI0039B44A4F
MKNCPSCNSSKMRKYEFHQQEVDQCQDCHGIWLELGELDGALSIADNNNDQVLLEQNLGEVLGQSDRHCYVCDQRLTRYHLMSGFKVEVDACSGCHGVWLDNDELEKVSQSPAIAEALLELDKPVHKRTWLFQFLSQMPVEYNLKPKRTPWVTYALLVFNVLIFMSYGLGAAVKILHSITLLCTLTK